MDCFTKRNHYNPCFWTACWNPDYFRAIVEGQASSMAPRKQKIFVLNLLSGNIYCNRVENVHFDRDLGIAEITPETMLDFCRRHYPSHYQRFVQDLEQHPESLCMDFEDILTGMEGLAGYQALMNAVTSSRIMDVTHKGFLTCHIVIQAMRSHEMMVSMLDTADHLEMPKWEYFWLLKNAWSNYFVMIPATMPLAFSRWTLYVTDGHRFPLCDSPVMIRENSLMTVLSPRLLLEIDLNTRAEEGKWAVREGISPSKFREFRRRAIRNSFKEIIFHDQSELEAWRKTPEFKSRSRELNSPDSLSRLRSEAAGRVIWAVNGFGGRLPPNISDQIRDALKDSQDSNLD